MPRRVTLEGNESMPRMEERAHGLKKTPQSQTPATPIPVQSPPYSPPTDWKREYGILREAYWKQERRLNALQEENLHLEKQIQAMLGEGGNCTRPAADHAKTDSTMSTTRKTLRNSSPGSRFVAELSEVMDLEAGQHALLSSIMDRQGHAEESIIHRKY